MVALHSENHVLGSNHRELNERAVCMYVELSIRRETVEQTRNTYR